MVGWRLDSRCQLISAYQVKLASIPCDAVFRISRPGDLLVVKSSVAIKSYQYTEQEILAVAHQSTFGNNYLSDNITLIYPSDVLQYNIIRN